MRKVFFTLSFALVAMVALGNNSSFASTLAIDDIASLKYANTSTNLTVAYYEAGPSNGSTVLCIHGFPYSPDAYSGVIPILVRNGYRVIAPYLRDYGDIRFLYTWTPRSAEQAALGSDVIALMDAIHLEKAIFAGYDWGTVAVNVAAALWPERCSGLVAVSSYAIQNRNTAWAPLDPDSEFHRWYYYLFLTPRGEAALVSNPKLWAKVLWQKNSVGWIFPQEYLDRTAVALQNPDYIAIVLNYYRNMLLYASGDPYYNDLALKLD